MPLNTRQAKDTPFYRFKNKKLTELDAMQLFHWNQAPDKPYEFKRINNEDDTHSLLRLAFSVKKDRKASDKKKVK